MISAKLLRTLPSALFAATLLTAGCAPEVSDIPPGGRQAAPEFSLASVDGRQLTLQDLAGKVAILDFWATWCSPCHLQGEILEELHEEYGDGKVEIVSIDSGEKAEKVRAFVEKNPKPFVVLVDADNKVSDEYQVAALPTVILLDRQGRIAFKSVGLTEASVLRPLIRKELARAAT